MFTGPGSGSAVGEGALVCGVKENLPRGHAAATVTVAQSVPEDHLQAGSAEAFRLDELLDEDVRVLRLDVGGREPEVLAGMTGLLPRRKVWFMIIKFR